MQIQVNPGKIKINLVKSSLFIRIQPNDTDSNPKHWKSDMQAVSLVNISPYTNVIQDKIAVNPGKIQINLV